MAYPSASLVTKDYFILAFFLPQFTWLHRVLGKTGLATDIPAAPRLFGPVTRRLVGRVHAYLASFSMRYCKWCGIEYNNQICDLPFGLVLKRSDGTRLEEVAAMKVARAAGFPVPVVLSYGDHPDKPHAPVSILITRLPGEEMGQAYETLEKHDQERIFLELERMLAVMRSWTSPFRETPICSILGTPIRSVRVPFHVIEPCRDEVELNRQLRCAASGHSFETKEQFEEKLACAKCMDNLTHDIVYTHGDFKSHNILVYQGNVSGFIDWESAGWYPSYWEFTTAMRMLPEDFWWYRLILRIGDSNCMSERECEMALTSLTIDSYVW